MTADDRELPDPVHVCRFCGFPIDDPDQQCAALADGRCRP